MLRVVFLVVCCVELVLKRVPDLDRKPLPRHSINLIDRTTLSGSLCSICQVALPVLTIKYLCIQLSLIATVRVAHVDRHCIPATSICDELDSVQANVNFLNASLVDHKRLVTGVVKTHIEDVG